ncbi:hypothetical protein Tco_1107850 [Tanacetum coccineum]
MTPPPSFSTPPQIPNINTSVRPPVTTTVFATTTPENTPFAYRASTSANPNPMISPAFVEANYEIEARENGNMGMNLPPLLVAHLGRNESGQSLQSSLTSVYEGHQPSTNIGENLPPNGAICMQKWLMPITCHMFTYTLKDSARIWWNSQKAGSILNYQDLKAKFPVNFSKQKKFTKDAFSGPPISTKGRRNLRTRSLVEHLSTDLPSTYKGLMEKTYMWIEAREVATNGAPNDQREKFKRSKKSSWDNNRGHKNKDMFSPYRGPNHGFLSSLSKSLREILPTEKVARSFEQPPYV